MISVKRTAISTLLLLSVIGCGGNGTTKVTAPEEKQPELDIQGDWIDPERDYPQGSVRAEVDLKKALVNPNAKAIAITNATIMTAAGTRYDRGTIVLEGGAIKALGAHDEVTVPSRAEIIDGTGKFVTPGIIDTHSHIGVYSSPNVRAHSDGNEVTAPVTAHARVEYGYSPQDPAITRARAGGVTTAQILPGSANLIGGRGLAVVMKPGRVVEEVLFPGAPPTIKMACGENPKRVYGEKGGPMTRMAEYAAFRATFQQAADYNAKLVRYRRGREEWKRKRARAREIDAKAARRGSNKRIKPEAAPEPPARDLSLETLAAVLRGEVLVQIHCYRASEMRELVAIADEYDFSIRSFHHALEAYKVRDILVEHKIAISTWADWWGFKMEAFDGIPENAALFAESGGRSVIHSDSAIGIQRLNQEASKALHSGRAAGINLSEDEALRWVTANPAWVLGIDRVTGTLEVGKRADVVVWNTSPLSVYSLAETVIQGGEVTYRRSDGLNPTDFELGNSAVDTKLEVTR
jgi:imidazolonepropionase-like amidohydrolase